MYCMQYYVCTCHHVYKYDEYAACILCVYCMYTMYVLRFCSLYGVCITVNVTVFIPYCVCMCVYYECTVYITHYVYFKSVLK